MKKILGLLLCDLMMTSLGACSKSEQRVVQGSGQGFGGEIKVEVTLEGDKIVKVTAIGENETQGIGSEALEKLPVAIQEKGSLEVDVIVGATLTSKGIIYAVNNALDPEAYPYPLKEEEKEVNEDSFMAEIASWQTKRGRGDGYVMGTGTWEKQMDKCQELFVGKSAEEVKDWFSKYTSDKNGRPLKADASDEKDKAKYDALSDEEKAMLAEVTSAATMSLNDSHGNILEAIKKAYDNRVEVEISIE